MKRNFIFGMAIFILLCTCNAYAKNFTQDELIHLGGKVAAGKVIYIGAFSFILQDEAGKTFEYLSSNKTSIKSTNKGLIVGDVAEVLYFDPISASRSHAKRFAKLITITSTLGKLPIREGKWIDAVISFTIGRSNKMLYFPENDLLLKVERFKSNTPKNLMTPVGTKISVKLKAVRQNSSSGMVYIVQAVKKWKRSK